MLKFDPNTRPSCQELLEYSFFKQRSAGEDRKPVKSDSLPTVYREQATAYRVRTPTPKIERLDPETSYFTDTPLLRTPKVLEEPKRTSKVVDCGVGTMDSVATVPKDNSLILSCTPLGTLCEVYAALSSTLLTATAYY
jgi:hypothetical protein